jgi:hypothetical protein
VLLLHELQPSAFSNGRKEPRLSPDTRSRAGGTRQLPWPQIERELVEALGKRQTGSPPGRRARCGLGAIHGKYSLRLEI